MEGRRIQGDALGVVAVAGEMLTPFGYGTQACWRGLMEGRTAVSKIERFDTSAFQSENAATVEGLKYHGTDSLVIQMLSRLFAEADAVIPRDALLIAATTKGEIDLLEKKLLAGQRDFNGYGQGLFLQRVASVAGVKDKGMLVSAACSSASAAVARGAAMIRAGRTDCVLVVACDSVTEFVFSGFSSLMALDRVSARPFDADRSGLSLGEAAAWLLLMSKDRALHEGRNVLGEVLGSGMSDDANHMTGPSRSSEGLILALTKAISSAGLSAADIGFISAHGTGTLYNDEMEMRAFRVVFENARPVYSVKGAIGHTMGTAGLIEILIALRALKEKQVPPTVGLQRPDADAEEWVSTAGRELPGRVPAIVTNAGFGGVNAAVVLY